MSRRWILALGMAAALAAPGAAAQEVTGPLRIHDGGAISINLEWATLDGVHGPWTDDLCESGGVPWQCGLAAMAWFADVTSGNRYHCVLADRPDDPRRFATCTEVDRETAARIPGAEPINRLFVRAGWALAAEGGGYEADERAAREAGAGMWALGGPEAPPPPPPTVAGPARVLDGNTLEIAGVRVRLFGADAPDLLQYCVFNTLRFECGYYARSHLASLILGGEVSCELVDSPRIFGRCRRADGGPELAARMVADGWAVADREMSQELVPAELEARRENRGLWLSTFVLPSQWRAGRR